MFGETVFALIHDHDVRAATLTNRWMSGCWWGRDASSDEHLVGTKQFLLKCISVRKKPPGEQWSRRETIEARGTKWNFDVENGFWNTRTDPGTTLRRGMPTATAQEEIPTVPPPAPPPEEQVPEMQVHSNTGGGDVTAKTPENARSRSARESTQDSSHLVTNRQDSWMPGMRDSRSGDVTRQRRRRLHTESK